MSDTILILGPVAFRDFEIPEKVNFGGAQRLAVHQLPGGARVIDALGRDDADITFTGTFTGADATLRARALDELRALGTALPLTWDVFTYSVVVKDFTAQYANAHWIPFRLTCAVLRDEAAALIEAPLSLATSVLGDIGTALAFTSGFALSGLATALSASGAMQRGTQAYAGASTQLARARDAIATGIANTEAGLDAGALTAPSISRLNSAAAAQEQLANLTMARAYAGRAAINLANAST